MQIRRFISFLFDQEAGNYLLIVLFSLFAHGLLLLNDGVYWDGWLIYVAKLQDRWNLVYTIYADRGGLPVYTAFHWAMRYFPSFVFGYKLVAYLFILGSAIITYQIARQLGLSRIIALFISLISLTFPANQATVELIVIPYLFSYFLFCIGCLILVVAENKSRQSTILWRFGAIVFFLLSFRMYSLLVHFYGFLFIMFISQTWRNSRKSWPTSANKFLVAHLDFFLLPIVFWFLNSWLFPPSGPYVTSDEFILDRSIFPLAGRFIANSLFGQVFESLKNLANPVILVIIGLFAVVMYFSYKPPEKDERLLRRKKTIFGLFLLGLTFFFTGMVPYILVGRSTMLHGWSTRNAVLIAVPTALIIVSFLLIIFPFQFAKKRPKAFPKILMVVLSSLVILFTTETAKFYLGWQLRAIKDNSVIANFARGASTLDDTTIFFVYDKFRVGGESKYRPHEYYGMFERAFPGRGQIGFDVNYYTYEEYFLGRSDVRKEQLELWYPNLDPYGCQAEMHIEAGSIEFNTWLFPKYFYYRYINGSGLERFLQDVTTLRFVPIDSTLATNCRR